ncbi:MAG: FHA domain-containing protein [Pseudomonadales bacterium]
MEAQTGPRLVLTWQNSQLSVQRDEHIVVGGAVHADLAVTGLHVSREHLHIYLKDHYFVVCDTSTNGTTIQSEDDEVLVCKRREQRLWGQGWLALGEPLALHSAVHFRHVQA